MRREVNVPLQIIPRQVIPASDLTPTPSPNDTPSLSQYTHEINSTPPSPILETTHIILEDKSEQLQIEDTDDDTTNSIIIEEVEQQDLINPTQIRLQYKQSITKSQNRRNKIAQQNLLSEDLKEQRLLHNFCHTHQK